jgi:hypothetical protein
MRGGAGSLVRITTCSVMRSAPMRGSECRVGYLALLLASVLTQRYRVTVLTSLPVLMGPCLVAALLRCVPTLSSTHRRDAEEAAITQRDETLA